MTGGRGQSDVGQKRGRQKSPSYEKGSKEVKLRETKKSQQWTSPPEGTIDIIIK